MQPFSEIAKIEDAVSKAPSISELLNQEKTLEEIGTYYGVSRERIRQIENRAISKLKKLCRNNNINKNLKNYI